MSTLSNKKILIATASDAKFGDFLIEHWLKSLLLNIDRNLVDITILDYGLTDAQKSRLIEKDVNVMQCKRDGHVVNIRYRDLLTFLQNNTYEQAMICDGGDMIFQANIMELFEENTEEFRAVCEDIPPPAIEFTLLNNTFTPELSEKISLTLKNRKMINGGLVVGSAQKIQHLCEYMLDHITDSSLFGPDQVVLNYLLYTEGFHQLPSKYNFVITTSNEKFTIKNGTFYIHKNEYISIVHNAGAKPYLRPIKDFGFGPEHNKFKPIAYYLLRTLYRTKKFSDIALRILRKGKKA